MRNELSDGSKVMHIRSTALGVAASIFIMSPAASAALCTRLPLSDVALNKADATTAARKKLGQYAAEKLSDRGWSGEGNVTARNETVTCTPYFSFGAIAAGFRCLVTATFCVDRTSTVATRVAPSPTIRQVPVPRPVQRPDPPRQARQTPPAHQTVTSSLPRATVKIQRNVAAPAKPPSGQVRRQAGKPAGKRFVKLRLKGSSYEISGVLKKYDKVSYVIAPPDSENITVPADRFDCVSGACPKATN